MRIRIIKDITLPGYLAVRWVAGSVAEMPTYIAERWIAQGNAMLDKSMDGGTEIKALPKALQPNDKALQNKREKTRDRVKRYRDKKNGIIK